MAQPIRATPTLVGEEALLFLERMRKNDSARPTKSDRQLLDLVKENRKLFAARF